jgi:LAO/AO transport system kinase
MIAVNKADGDNLKRRAAAAEYNAALHILAPRSEHWFPPVLTYSALTGDGSTRWEKIVAHRTAMVASGEFERRAAGQMDVDDP